MKLFKPCLIALAGLLAGAALLCVLLHQPHFALAAAVASAAILAVL